MKPPTYSAGAFAGYWMKLEITMVTDVGIIFLLFSYFARVTAFACYKDLCLQGLQYCVDEREKCFWCKDIPHLCGTQDLPMQCDAYCTGLEATKRAVQLNATFEESLERSVGEGRGYKISTFTLLGAAFVFLCIGIYLYKHKQKQNLPKGNDPEKAELIHSENKVDNMSQTEFRNEYNNTDDFNDVSLTSKANPETASKESGVDSLATGDHEGGNDQNDPQNGDHGDHGDQDNSDTELMLGANKREEVKTRAEAGKGIGTRKELGTQAMNPTNGKYDTVGFALNGDPCRIYKDMVRPTGIATS